VVTLQPYEEIMIRRAVFTGKWRDLTTKRLILRPETPRLRCRCHTVQAGVMRASRSSECARPVSTAFAKLDESTLEASRVIGRDS
jgi:hypothetical protein